MTLQKLLGYTRRAAADYAMIRGGDKIAVGLSGGKDSVSLLIALAEMRKFYPARYDVAAVTVSLGFEGFDASPLKSLCGGLGVEYSVVETDIADVVFKYKKEKNPCALCSKMRKAALYNEAVRLGCNRTALGHNRNDVIQTFFMSMFYEGRIHTFGPVSYLDRADVFLIRPLVYVPEKEINSFVKKSGTAIVKNPCPADGNTVREEIKNFIREQAKKIPDFEEKIFGQIIRLPVAGWERG